MWGVLNFFRIFYEGCVMWVGSTYPSLMFQSHELGFLKQYKIKKDLKHLSSSFIYYNQSLFSANEKSFFFREHFSNQE